RAEPDVRIVAVGCGVARVEDALVGAVREVVGELDDAPDAVLALLEARDVLEREARVAVDPRTALVGRAHDDVLVLLRLQVVPADERDDALGRGRDRGAGARVAR